MLGNPHHRHDRQSRALPQCIADDLRGRHFRERRALVRGRADVRQDGAAAAGRLGLGVVGRHGVLPDRAAGGLCLCACADSLCPRPQRGALASGGAVRGGDHAAARHRRSLAASAAGGRDALAAWAVHGFDRAAVLRPRGQRPAAPSMVCPHRSSGRARPLLSLRREQYRQLSCAPGLSDPDRAVHSARQPEPAVDRGLLSADRADRRQRHPSGAFRRRPWHRRTAGTCHAGPGAARSGVMVRARGGAGRPAGRRHGLSVDRRGRRAAALGGAARALSADAGDRFPAPADHPASLSRVRAAGIHSRADRRARVRSARRHPADGVDPLRRVLRQCAGLPRRAGAPAAAARASDALLSLRWPRAG